MIHIEIPLRFENEYEAIRWANSIKDEEDFTLPQRLLSRWLALYVEYMKVAAIHHKPSMEAMTEQVFFFEKAVQIICWNRDQAMSSDEYYDGHKLPVFKSANEAIDWAHEKKWTEPLRRMLKQKIKALYDEVFNIELSHSYSWTDKVLPVIEQVDFYLAALKVIEDYKHNTVGSVVMASSEPVRRNYGFILQNTH